MRLTVPPLLREREFGLFWAGQAISLVGDQVSLVALPLTAVLVLHAGAREMGLLATVALLPNLLFSLHAGAWVDRRGRRRHTMIAADIARGVLVATIPVASALGFLTLAQLLLVAFLVGSLGVLFSVSYGSLFVSLVARERFVEASSLLNGSRAFSYVLGPSLAGVLVQLLRAPFALVLDAISYLASALFLLRIAPPEQPAEEDGGGRVADGLRFILGSPLVRAALGATATINFFNFVFFALFILYATRSLNVAPGTLGAVLGAGAVGGVAGSIVTGRLSRRIGIGPTFVAGCLLFPAPLVLVPLASGPEPLVLGALFLAELGSGFGVMVLDISIGSIFAAVIPGRLRSRVAGAYMLVNYGVRPLGTLMGGLLGSTIGLRPTLWIATVGALTGVLWLVPSPLPRLRDLPDAAQEPGLLSQGGAPAVEAAGT